MTDYHHYWRADGPHKYWHDVWLRAYNNMPARKGKLAHFGQWAALTRCLGLPTHTSGPKRNYVAGATCWRKCAFGHKPRNQAECAQLLRLAGPYGRIFALITLNRLGLAKRYDWRDL
jgi:hypothetical protein